MQFGQFLLDVTAAEEIEAACGIVPGGFRERFEQDFEEQAAVFFFERGAEGSGVRLFIFVDGGE